MHGQYGGAQDVDAVNLVGGHHAYGPGQGLGLDDGAQSLAAPLRDLLRVVKPRMMEVGRQYDGGGKDRAGEAAAAGFVASGLEHRGIEAVGQ